MIAVRESGLLGAEEAYSVEGVDGIVYDEEGNEVSAPVLASNYSVDVLWKKEELLDENDEVSYPYGWGSKEISIEEGNGVHTFAGWSFNS